MKTSFYAVILAGGSGERFWPLSTSARPKQFLAVFGGKSLLRQAVDRLAGLVPPDRILVLTAAALLPATRRELPMLPRANLVGEPCRRDTAAAVATACGLVARRGGPSAIAAILTADQLMTDIPAFRRVLADAVTAAARSPSIVTMGIEPDRPATGFGYIELGHRVRTGTCTAFAAARRYVEKPDLATARRYLRSGRYVWNAGMFVWRVSTMLDALASAAPALAALARAVAAARSPARVLARAYPPLPKISVDYAVMEKASNILVARGSFGWDDVGSWTALDKHFPHDARGNVTRGPVTLLDSDGSVIVADGPRAAVLGVRDLVVVTTRDAVLVAPKGRVADLKKLVAALPTVP